MDVPRHGPEQRKQTDVWRRTQNASTMICFKRAGLSECTSSTRNHARNVRRCPQGTHKKRAELRAPRPHNKRAHMCPKLSPSTYLPLAAAHGPLQTAHSSCSSPPMAAASWPPSCPQNTSWPCAPTRQQKTWICVRCCQFLFNPVIASSTPSSGHRPSWPSGTYKGATFSPICSTTSPEHDLCQPVSFLCRRGRADRVCATTTHTTYIRYPHFLSRGGKADTQRTTPHRHT